MADRSDPQDRSGPQKGLDIRGLTVDEFRDFAERHATSPKLA